MGKSLRGSVSTLPARYVLFPMLWNRRASYHRMYYHDLTNPKWVRPPGIVVNASRASLRYAPTGDNYVKSWCRGCTHGIGRVVLEYPIMTIRNHLFVSVLGSSLLVPVLSAHAQSPLCKGKAEADCKTVEFKGVKNICTYIQPRQVLKDTGVVGEIKGYCRVNNRKLTDDEKKLLASTTN